jgi:hypothetical protein
MNRPLRRWRCQTDIKVPVDVSDIPPEKPSNISGNVQIDHGITNTKSAKSRKSDRLRPDKANQLQKERHPISLDCSLLSHWHYVRQISRLTSQDLGTVKKLFINNLFIIQSSRSKLRGHTQKINLCIFHVVSWLLNFLCCGASQILNVMRME